MSLFSDFQQGQIIEKPRNTTSYAKILKEKKEDTEKERKRKWKELCEEKKKEMSKEEFLKRRQKERYQQNKKKVIEYNTERYYREREDEEALLEEIYKSVYDPIPEPINYNKLYAEKYDEDDRGWGWRFVYYWWASRLRRVSPTEAKKIKYPVRIYNRSNIPFIFSYLWKEQDMAYEYIKPHLDEINLKDFFIAYDQGHTYNPMWVTKNKIRELTDATDIGKWQICSVASALLRDKYIVNELYLGRVCYLVGDIIISWYGHIFRPILENNIPRLTKDTVEELHQKRFDYLARKIDDLPIYVLWDAYLVKIPINERETYFYIIPT